MHAVLPARRYFGCGLSFESVFDKVREKIGEGRNVPRYAPLFQCSHVVVPFFERDGRPRIPAGCKHDIHQETARPPVSIHIRVDVDKYEMPEDNTGRGIGFLRQQLEKCRHQIAHGVPLRRNVPGTVDIDLAGTITSKLGRL